MSGWPAKLTAAGRRVGCHNCGGTLGYIWQGSTGERRLLLPTTMAIANRTAAPTRRAVRAQRHGHQPFRRPVPAHEFSASTIAEDALEPTRGQYPLSVRCPRCNAMSYVEPEAIDIVVPEPEDSTKTSILWPMTERLERIGELGPE